MGKMFNNKVDKNKQRASIAYYKKVTGNNIKGSVGLKDEYSKKDIVKSRSQAKSDGGFQSSKVARSGRSNEVKVYKIVE